MKILVLAIAMIYLPAAVAGVDISLTAGSTLSQHYGVEFGYEEYEIDKGFRIGLLYGISLNYTITDIFSIQQDYLYSYKGSSQSIGIKDRNINMDVRYHTNYLEIPTCMKLYQYRGERISLYSLSGFSFAYLINSRYTIDGMVKTADEHYPLKVDQKMNNIDQFDYGIILGGGLDIKMGSLDNLNIEYRVNFGIPFLELPTTEDIVIEGHHIDNNPQRVKLRNLSYSLILRYGLF